MSIQKHLALIIFILLVVVPAQAEVTFLNAWGTYGIGNGQFDTPTGIAVGPTGRVYIVDQLNSRVQRFSVEGAYETEWGGIGTADGSFNSPEGIAISPTGQVFVADRNNDRIQRFDADGTFETKWGVTGSGNGGFLSPYGVSVNSSGKVYVVDSNNDRIQRFKSDGTFETKWGSSGSGDGQFLVPIDVALGPTGQVYVTDFSADRIQRFSSVGTFETKWGSSGTGGGSFDGPNGLAVSDANQVYVADVFNHRIQRFDSDGVFEIAWGNPGSADGQFQLPQYVTVTPTGFVYVSDSGNHRIQRFFDSDAWVSGTNNFVNSVTGPIHVGLGSGQVLGQSLNLNPSKGLNVAGTTSIEADGALTLSGGSFVTDTLAFNDGLLLLDSSVTLSTVTTLLVNPGAGVINTNGHDLLTDAYLTGAGALVKSGVGNLALTGSGTLGAVSVEGGTLILGNTLNTSSVDILADGALQVDSSGRLNGVLLNSGVVSGGGEVVGSLTNNSGGEVRVATGERLFVGAPISTHTNSGRIEVVGGEVEFRGPVMNSPTTGRIVGRNGTLRFGGPLLNDGVLALSYGISDVFGVIDNTSTGRVTITGESQATFYDDVANEGTVQTSAGSSAVYLGDVTGSGSFTGTGTNYFEGDVYPGSSAGTMDFEGDVVLSALTTLGIEIGGTAANNFDSLDIDGSAALDGMLAVSLIDPMGGTNVFVPSAGDTFEFLRADGGLGGTTFDSLVLPALSGSLTWFVDYGSNDVSLLVTFTSDFDFDFDVDLDDLDALTLVGDLTTGVAVSQADAKYDLNGDNTIDTADLHQWLADAATVNGFSSPYLLGDANLDGDVDVFQFDGNGDAQLLSSNLGTTSGAKWSMGDFNADGDVDVFQFDGGGDAQLLSSNLGMSSSPLLSSSVAPVVPEPTTCALALAALCLAMNRRWI